jgi:hypothetical protein
MRTIACVVALVASWSAAVSAQCCGDCNGDGQVTINELITAVNNALNGCTAPTRGRTPTVTRRPTATATPVPRCTVSFTSATGGSRLCQFRGTYNRGCGNTVTSTFASTGSLLAIAVETLVASPPVVYFQAQVQTAASAALLAWSTDPNFLQDVHPLNGAVQLNGNGTQFVIFPNDPPFMIQGCNFVQYVGAFDGTLGAAALTAQDRGGAREGPSGFVRSPASQLPNFGAPAP